jgi:Domain of unknown function (DUF397)
MSDWRKSTFSNDNGGDCVELASGDGAILVRDTMNRRGPVLTVSAVAWEAFTASLR